MGRAEQLAELMAMERRIQIEQEFYEEVTEKEYNAWYAKNGGRKQAGKAGFSVYDGEMFRYYMISKAKRAKGGMTKQAVLAHRLMRFSKGSNVVVTDEGKQALVRMVYENMPYEYKKTTFAEVYGDTDEERHYVLKSGRMSKLDKLIISSIKRWGDTYGIRILTISSTYVEDGNENT